jgi:hypothetical protein
MYVLPLEKHELELVTSTCTMSCHAMHCCMNVLASLSYPPLLTDLEDNREVDVRGLGSFTKAVNGPQKYALGERA